MQWRAGLQRTRGILELRFLIKFLTKKGKKPKEIHESVNAVYCDVSPSYFQVKFLSKEFKLGRVSIEDDSLSGRPVEASSKAMLQKVEDMILQDPPVKVSVIAHELGISAGTVSCIFRSVLMMSKVSSRWVPRMVTPEQKVCRRQFNEENLDRLSANPEKSYQELLQGMKPGSIILIQTTNESPCNGNTKRLLLPRNSVCKNLPEISWQKLWDSEGVLLLEFMPQNNNY